MAAVLVGCLSAASSDQGRIGSWGLITALRWPFFAALVVLALSFFSELVRGDGRSRVVLGAGLGGLVLLLHGVPGFVESEPRFATAWLHAGFTRELLDAHVTRPEADARFSWPAFFAAAAALARAGGVEDPVALLRWAPVISVLLYLPPLWLLGRHLTRSDGATWLGLWLFVPANWVGQDYFSPQTAGFILYLLAVSIVVTFFADPASARTTSTGRRARLLALGDAPPDLGAGPVERCLLLVVVIGLLLALAVTHQLSPVIFIATSVLLVLVGRLRPRALPAVAVVITLGWISLGTMTYWTGHLDAVVGSLGSLSGAIGGVEQRVGGSVEHLLVARLRLVFAVVIWLLAGWSAAHQLVTRRRVPWTLLVLTAAPVVALLQGYGGEGSLRFYFFSAPFACFLIAAYLHRLGVTGRRSSRVRTAASQLPLVALSVSTMLLFLLCRYGNESFEQVRPAEVEAVADLYRLAPTGSNLVTATTQVPWRSTHATDYHYLRPNDPLGFREADLRAVRDLVDESEASGRETFLLVTTGQQVYATEALGEPPGWFPDRLQPLLTPDNGYYLVHQDEDASVYRFERP